MTGPLDKMKKWLRMRVQTKHDVNALALRPDAAFSILELSLAVAVLTMAAIGTLQLSIATVSLEAQNRETAIATSISRKVIEDMKSVPFQDLFSTYNADTEDDPTSSYAPGNTFLINASAIGGPQVDFQVAVNFPVDENGDLSEQVSALATGLPTDLNTDGSETDPEDLVGYRVLPSLISVNWVSANGNDKSMSIPVIFTDRTVSYD